MSLWSDNGGYGQVMCHATCSEGAPLLCVNSVSESLILFVEYHAPDSKAVIRNLVYKFMRRLDAFYNKLVIAVINSDIKWQSRIR